MGRLCQAAFGGPEHVLQYLARYTYRVAISNHRLLSVDDKQVRRWKDYAHDNKPRVMTLSDEEFLRRFFNTCFRKGSRASAISVGSLSDCGSMLKRCRQLLQCLSPPDPVAETSQVAVCRCAHCNGQMRIVERLNACGS